VKNRSGEEKILTRAGPKSGVHAVAVTAVDHPVHLMVPGGPLVRVAAPLRAEQRGSSPVRLSADDRYALVAG
jgi:hypothetical protein